jgi:hypothetical protein
VVAEEEVDEALDLTAEIATGVEEEVGERKRLADAPAELAASPPSWSR